MGHVEVTIEMKIKSRTIHAWAHRKNRKNSKIVLKKYRCEREKSKTKFITKSNF